MSKLTTDEELETLPRFINEAINARIEFCADEIIEKLKKEIDSRRDEIITGVILNVKRIMSVTSLHDEMTITIKKERDKD